MDPQVEDRLRRARQRPVDVTRDRAGVDPDAVWDRGEAWGRRRRRATWVGGLLALVLALGVGAATWAVVPSTTQVQPARSEAAPALPDRIALPTGTLPALPAGPAIFVGTMGSPKAPTFYGVSATTGSYGALDLPGISSGVVSLSPDGRYLAYWITGETQRQPGIPAEVGGSGLESRAVTTGVAIKDLTTGQVRTHQIRPVRGLSQTFLGWASQDQVIYFATTYEKDASADDPVTSKPLQGLWDASGSTTPTEEGKRFSSVDTSQARDGLVMLPEAKRVELWDTATGTSRFVPLGTASVNETTNGAYAPLQQVALGPDGRAAVMRPKWTPNERGGEVEDQELLIGQVPDDNTTMTWTRTPGRTDVTLLGWRGTKILAEWQRKGGAVLGTIDPFSGERAVLSELGERVGQEWSLARDLAEQAPMRPAVEPGTAGEDQSSTRQALAGGGALLVALLAGLGVWVWRRRVHA